MHTRNRRSVSTLYVPVRCGRMLCNNTPDCNLRHREIQQHNKSNTKYCTAEQRFQHTKEMQKLLTLVKYDGIHAKYTK